MVFVDESVVIEGTTYWPIHTVPVEERPGGQPLLGVEVEVTAVDGSAIVIRDAGSKEVISSTVLSSSVYGTTPNLYAPVPTVRLITEAGIPLFVTSVAYINLQDVILELVARAEAAKADAQLARQAAEAAAASAAASGGGGSGNAGIFEVSYNGTAWEFLTLQAALDAGMKSTDRAWFLGAPRTVSPPSWIRDDDLVGYAGATA